VTDRVRRQRVENVCHAALELDVAERAAFIAAACGDDSALRREVETLLAHAQTAEGFLVAPMGAVAAQVLAETGGTALVGRQIGSYTIQSRLGSGGMGEVYRARDTKLGRDVAIKILPRAFTSDPERLARFEREARMLAALNHPHIGAIYGVEEVDGIPALILEFIEGPTLADRLAKGRIPLNDSLPVARQIADALEAAHEKGIVHRDLKPANIKITADGVVKVLDFGLAKAVTRGSTPDLTQSPTVTIGGTRDGVILGTAAYMSPEQARGEAVDKRTDIWAFGCVLYELLTGHVAFPGKTIPDTLVGILEREPDWTLLPVTTVPSVRRLLDRCLEKNPKRRLRDIGDAAFELGDAITSPAKVAQLRKPVPRWIWGMTSVLMFGLAIGWSISRVRQPTLVENRAVRLAVTPPAGTEFGVDTGTAISPDGRMLAFVTGSTGRTKLWVRPLNSLSARELSGTDGATFPFWSPDGRSLGFFAGGKLKRMEIAAGLPTVICDVGVGRGGTWNEAGMILFNSVNDGPLLRVSATGGTPVPFTTVDTAQGENSHRWPQFLPGGRRFLYFVRTTNENSGVYVGSLDRPREKALLLRSPTNAIYVPDRGKPFGHLLWVRDGTLMAQPFDPEQDQTTGESATVAERVAFGPLTRLGAVSASNNGTLVYDGEGIRHFQFTWYDRDGKQVGEVGQPDEYVGLRISPDGKRVAATRSGDVWQMEFASGIPTRVTFSGGVDPLWSPDSQRIAYWKGGPNNLFSHNTNGTGDEVHLIESRDSLRTQDWTPDGRLLLYLRNSNDLSSKARLDLGVLPMTGDRKPVAFLSTPFQEGRGQFSPDSKWVAYTSDESGANEVYVQSFPAGGGKWQVSSKGGDWVRWRRDGQEIFYIAGDRKLMSVAVQAMSGSLKFGTPRALFTIPFVSPPAGVSAPYTYDVMPGGQRFLALVPAGDAAVPPMTVVLDWQAELSTAARVVR
jgi:serine/threonine protein kinase/Tol biopolymer transport system component